MSGERMSDWDALPPDEMAEHLVASHGRSAILFATQALELIVEKRDENGVRYWHEVRKRVAELLSDH